MTAAYSFQDCVATITGPSGSANLGYGASVADEGITIAMAEDKNTMTVGADGNVMHSQHASKAGHLTVRLLQTSPINQLLMAIYDAQQASPTVWGKNVIVVSQTQSGDITTCNKVAFKKKPDNKYSKDGAVYDWQFDCGSIDTILGTY